MASMKRANAARAGMIRVRIDPDLKARAEMILESAGLSAGEAIGLFYERITLEDGLPFPMKVPNSRTSKALRDADAGKGLTRYAGANEMFEDLGI